MSYSMAMGRGHDECGAGVWHAGAAWCDGARSAIAPNVMARNGDSMSVGMRRNGVSTSVSPMSKDGSAGRLRGKLLAFVLVLVLGCVGLAAWTVQPARSEPGAMHVTSYIVRPGETLWSYASRVTPEGQDVAQTVDQLMALNDLESGSLRAGQRIIVPAE